jgi:hypothetical protein
MPSTSRTIRNKHFRAALALAGTTARDWAKAQDVTPGHLTHVLQGRRESISLTDKIDDFIVEHLRKIRITAA